MKSKAIKAWMIKKNRVNGKIIICESGQYIYPKRQPTNKDYICVLVSIKELKCP